MSIQSVLIGALGVGLLTAAVAGGCTYREHVKMQVEVDKANAATAAAKADLKVAVENEQKANTATKGFVDENTQLKALIAAQPAPGSVQCHVSATHRTAQAPTAGGAHDEPAPRAGPLQETPEHDTGNIAPELYGDADQCDEIVNELRHLREWAESVSH